ncbi:MAG: hypothetical protein EBY32_19130 [Proteobacteria bacterium]|nr:hypothetical protein [Pseudomonadota bacterium]
MNVSNLQNLLDLNWNLLKQALPSFERSLVKCRNLDFSPPISFKTEESLDALSSKFSRVSDIYTQKVLKTLIFLLREDAPTFLDRINLCEKLGIIPSAEEIIAIRDIRNIIAHEYLSENLVEIYMEIIQLSDDLLKSILQTEKFLIERKN